MKTTASPEAIGKYYVPMSYNCGSFPWILKHRQNSWNYVINWTHMYCMYVCVYDTHTNTKSMVIPPIKGGVAKWRCAIVHTFVWVLVNVCWLSSLKDTLVRLLYFIPIQICFESVIFDLELKNLKLGLDGERKQRKHNCKYLTTLIIM